MRRANFDIQGHFLGIPYDWRLPTAAKMKERWWNENASMLTPKLWGWGWDLNLRNRGTWVLLACTLFALLALA